MKKAFNFVSKNKSNSKSDKIKDEEKGDDFKKEKNFFLLYMMPLKSAVFRNELIKLI